MSEIIVSVVMPIYNEEKYIDNCIKSLLMQDYPVDNMEWIFVDGHSKDKTMDILKSYANQYPNLIRVYENEKNIIPISVNMGIKNACGKYVIRMDAHAHYESDYISKCVYHLENTDAVNVGGVLETRSRGFVGGAIAKMLSSKFGVGNSQFRTNGKSGYVDTVPFGAFKREFFAEHGGFDERLARGEDNEINYRIRKNGGKVYMSSDIKSTYYCRDSVKGITKQAYQNGLWNVITMRLCPGSMGLRHFIPFMFVISLIGLTLLSFVHWIFLAGLIAEVALYTLCDTAMSLKSACGIKEFFMLLFLFPTFHVCYGVGSLIGVFKLFSKRFRKKEYTAPKI